MIVPVSNTQSLVIPKKGTSIIFQAKEIPDGLKTLQLKKLITIDEL